MNGNDAYSRRSACIGFRAACLLLGLASTALAETWLTFDVPGANYVQPVAINGNGDVAGIYYASGNPHGFLKSSNGVITTFDVPGALLTSPAAINGNGDVAGVYADAGGFNHGFVRTIDGTFTTFDVPGALTQIGTNPTSINASGVVVGWYFSANPINYGGFLRTPDGTITTFNVPVGDTYPVSINDAGEIAGNYVYFCTYGFLRAPDGTITTFDFPNAACTGFNFVRGMNASGDVVGTIIDVTGVTHGFLRNSGGAITTFSGFGGNVPKPDATSACCINSSGQIAGLWDALRFARIFLREANGAIRDVGAPTCTLGTVSAMNDAGWITGTCFDPHSNKQPVVHGYLRMFP